MGADRRLLLSLVRRRVSRGARQSVPRSQLPCSRDGTVCKPTSNADILGRPRRHADRKMAERAISEVSPVWAPSTRSSTTAASHRQTIYQYTEADFASS